MAIARFWSHYENTSGRVPMAPFMTATQGGWWVDIMTHELLRPLLWEERQRPGAVKRFWYEGRIREAILWSERDVWIWIGWLRNAA